MPNATRISGAGDKPLAAPPDWDQASNGRCGALFIRRETIEGVEFMRSAWQFEQAEAALLLAGSSLLLGIAGDRHPVVHFAIDSIPEIFPPVQTSRLFYAPDGQSCVRVEILYCKAGGRRAFCEVEITDHYPYAKAIAHGIERIEELARREGWIE